MTQTDSSVIPETLAEYRRFLEAKVPLSGDAGFPCDWSDVNPVLKPHQRDAVCWLVRGGRRALFASFGLGKTVIQLEAVRLMLQKSGGGRGLIVMPLGVRQEFRRDAGMLGIPVRFVRTNAEVDGDGIYLTNYESVREGKLDPTDFTVVSLDEAGVLRGFGGVKTFREFMKFFEGSGIYRFVATATPSPNEFLELLAYSAFLDVMDVGQGKTRFFKRNSEKADQLTLLPHKEREFWLWVASWALFIQTPSDLGHSDEGYELPPLAVEWHQLPTDHLRTVSTTAEGQGRMFANAALGVTQASREKRSSLEARVWEVAEIVRATPRDEQLVIWCDLNDEQRAIERWLLDVGITVSSLFGADDVDERERSLEAWRCKETRVFLTKPSMYGAGTNLQQAHTMIFAGIGFKFAEFIQAIHRIHRFLQESPCTVHLVYTEAEAEVRRTLERKWAQHDELVNQMAAIIREYGLSAVAMASELMRTMGVERSEMRGENWTLINNDCVDETHRMEAESVDLIVTSIPFSTMYQYSPDFCDFGHTDDEAHFWRQMDFLTPQLFRVLRPGRNLVVHVKDRVTPAGISKLGFATVQPFHADAIYHYIRHGFGFLGMRTVVTDVVRENNQTYRLGWTEQCKDGSRMGVGMPEYLLLFRKPPTDRTNGYADVPVVKDKPLAEREDGTAASFNKKDNWRKPIPGSGYSRGRWQLDAHGFWRSDGNRLLSSEEVQSFPHAALYQLWKARSVDEIYDHEAHVATVEDMDYYGRLPFGFMLFPPHSWHPDVWSDVTRMRTLNGSQWSKGKELHTCPLQFDIVDRVIRQMSMPGELVMDPFSGLGTVCLEAVKLGRRGFGIELNPQYHADAVSYLRAAEQQAQMPTLFDVLAAEDGENLVEDPPLFSAMGIAGSEGQ